ncbi:hypothetical protein LTR37_016972 [Vermiconidia calcicola]|uniref:Uncharacterized protein n=1 Tax=Vermiconidia calcicola TaxID=1690605 RepID=A0ACC3MMV4_9PEZI|nr:hypothetical protein LTR37_016972 [Vermiconidia calcicola]
MAEAPPDVDLGNTYLYHQLNEYPWDQDQEFQGGLRAILGSVQDPAQVEHLTLRAKCYYFARKAGSPVDFDGYKQWVETQRGIAPTNGTSRAINDTLSGAEEPITSSQPTTSDSGGGMGGMGDAPKPASFAEICDMINEGKPIPGIKDIPDTILEGQASDTQATKRKKPWERSQEDEAPVLPTWLK